MTEDTFPKLLVRNYRVWGNKKVALRHKQLGIWREYTWEDFYLRVRALALGLLSLGICPGDKAAIIGDNAPEWLWAEFAIHCTRGASIGLFPDSSVAEVRSIIELSDSVVAFAKDQQQVDKLLELTGKLPQIRNVIYWNKRGLSGYRDQILLSFEELMALGRGYEQEHPGIFEHTVELGKGEDLAVLLLTSGTTGALPKLAMHSYASLLSNGSSYQCVQPVSKDDVYVAVTPMGWCLEQLSLATTLVTGRAINIPEALEETIQQDLRELGPTTIVMLSTQLESVHSLIEARVSDATFLKRLAYLLLLPLGYRRADLIVARKRPNFLWRVLFALTDLMLFNPLKDKLGLSKTKCLVSSGARISPDLVRYFAALGLTLKQLYITSETLGICAHTDDDIKLETLGRPLPGSEIEIMDNGEIAIKKGTAFLGYYKDPGRTNQVSVEGWYRTGDAGFTDEDGHLCLLDRMKDLIILADGAKFSPQYIECRLRFSPYIKDAVVFGGRYKPYLTALIIINFENVARWADSKNITFTSFADLSQKTEAYELVRLTIQQVNRTLPKEAQIRRFANFYKELEPDEAELTRTRKLRRAFFEKRYQEWILALYNAQVTDPIKTESKFDDSKVQKMRAKVQNVSVAVGE